MITEDYVNFETAKLLKKKRFSEDTICKYADVGGVTEKWYDDYRERVLSINLKEGYLIEPPTEPNDQYEIIGDTISAPTLQMAMKWLREVHEIIPIILTAGDSQNPFYYWFRIDTVKEGKFEDAIYREDEKEFPTYEQASEAAIKYCLENLI